jgi:hypothetical protein
LPASEPFRCFISPHFDNMMLRIGPNLRPAYPAGPASD